MPRQATSLLRATAAAAGWTGTLYATADAFVRDGAYANDNYGAAAAVFVKNYNSGFSRRAFLAFSIADVTTFVSATLRCYCTLLNGGTPTIAAAQITGAWTELGVTWNTQPSVGANVAATLISGTGWVEWDVTDYVAARIAAAQTTAELRLADNTFENVDTGFSSREGANSPELVIA